MNRPTSRSRFLDWLPAILLVVSILICSGLLTFVTGGSFLLLIAVPAAVAVIVALHYLLWGRLLRGGDHESAEEDRLGRQRNQSEAGER